MNCNLLFFNGLIFRKITNFAPEQWLIYRDGRLIGYVRLRHGILRASYAIENPSDDLFGFDILDGVFVYEFKDKHNNTNDLSCFDNDDQRDFWLNKISNCFK